MNEREVRIERIVGRRVRDADGRSIGRVEEMICEIELHATGRDYVVCELGVVSFGALDAITANAVVRQLLRVALRGASRMRYAIPWRAVDLSDPGRPRLNRPLDQRWREHGMD